MPGFDFGRRNAVRKIQAEIQANYPRNTKSPVVTGLLAYGMCRLVEMGGIEPPSNTEFLALLRV
jgi:hypothetical protein